HPAGLTALWRHSIQADIVHVHDARAHTLAAIGSRQRFVVSRRVAFPIGRSVLSRWKYRRAGRYLAVSRFVARQLIEAGISESRIDVVYDAVMPGDASGDWRPQYPAVGLASADPQKGRDLLVQDLRRASMFVYLTRSEGLGSAALLAMSMGVPVIASRVGGLPEIVENGVSGLLVENDPGEVAAAMRHLFEDHNLTRRLIQNATENVRAHFSENNLVTATLASYRRALAH